MALLIVQPILASYRVPLIDGLASHVSEDVLVCSDRQTSDYGDASISGGEFIEANFRALFAFKILSLKKFLMIFNRADCILHVADFKFSSLWLFIICCLFSKKKIFLHGQGGYKKSGLLHRTVYQCVVLLSDGYICYTHYSAAKLKSILPVFLHKKISVVENTLYLEPVDSILNCDSSDIFYIGRLREGCGLELLLEAAALAKVSVRIIGSGREEYRKMLESKYPNAKFYGGVFAREQQLEIAKGCLVGAYGGDAGLSVVHYMAFGLPVIVHSEIGMHMGPEPSYVEHNVNGLNFERGSVKSLSTAIDKLKEDSELRSKLAINSLNTFKALKEPSMHEKFIKILDLN